MWPSGGIRNACLTCTRPWVGAPVLPRGERERLGSPILVLIDVLVFLCEPKVSSQVFRNPPSPSQHLAVPSSLVSDSCSPVTLPPQPPRTRTLGIPPLPVHFSTLPFFLFLWTALVFLPLRYYINLLSVQGTVVGIYLFINSFTLTL